MKKIAFVFVGLGMAIAPVRAVTVTPDDTARFLAGLSCSEASPLHEIEGGQAWTEHAKFFNNAWRSLEQRQLSPIRGWVPGKLGGADGKPMFYMFSGPDFLYASTFFPHAPEYILAGLEPVGPLPDVQKLEKLPDSLANLRKSLDAVLNWSFFRTKDMKVDFQQTQLSGTLPVLYVFLARQDCHIDAVEFVAIDKEGKIVSAQPGSMGVRIRFTRSGEKQVLYYFSTNLADGDISQKFLNFCVQQGEGVALLKAASYLMYHEGFSTIRSTILAHNKIIVQDDSGIPLKFFDRNVWQLNFEGVYTAPTSLFKEHYQADLAEIYKGPDIPALKFGFGYQWRPKSSNLMIAVRKK